MRDKFEDGLTPQKVGLPRCGGPARAPAGGIVREPCRVQHTNVLPLIRGADVAARQPYLPGCARPRAAARRVRPCVGH